jgi:hypothetical protein
MTEDTQVEMTEQEKFQALVEQLQQSMDPRDFMTPTQREIAYMTTEQLETEYQLVQDRISPRSRMQRDLIVSRYEYEQSNKQNDEDKINS